MTVSGNKPWTRFVRFISPDGRQLCGEPVDTSVDVGQALASNEKVTVRVLATTSALEPGRFTGEIATIAKLLSPLSPSEVGTIRCIGLNFKDHAAELNISLPCEPEVFMKPAQCINNPLDPIVLPASAGTAIDAEVELAVIIGKDCKDATVDSAMDFVLGYTVANDVTARDVQTHTSQWGYCKSYDGFCPLGPALVRPQLERLQMRTELDGEVLQDQTTGQMIFSVAEIIAHLSKDTTLPKGTVILTGTPAGIGHSYCPPRYLRDGSRLRVCIDGLGSLVNSVSGSVHKSLNGNTAKV